MSFMIRDTFFIYFSYQHRYGLNGPEGRPATKLTNLNRGRPRAFYILEKEPEKSGLFYVGIVRNLNFTPSAPRDAVGFGDEYQNYRSDVGIRGSGV